MRWCVLVACCRLCVVVVLCRCLVASDCHVVVCRVCFPFLALSLTPAVTVRYSTSDYIILSPVCSLDRACRNAMTGPPWHNYRHRDVTGIGRAPVWGDAANQPTCPTLDRSGIISARVFAVAAAHPRPPCLRRYIPVIPHISLHCYTAQRAASRSRPQVTVHRSCCRVRILCVACARRA